MALWLPHSAPHGWTRDEIGGKAFHLHRLAGWSFPVPRFGVVTTEAFERWKESGELPRELLTALSAEVASWNASSFAVRSSMTLEDGESASFAGILESFLHVPAAEIPARIVDCFRSLESDRARAYLERQADKAFAPRVAVVVQAMVEPVASGVAFSRSPSAASSLVYVEAGLGLGEGIVAGRVEVDAHWLDRFGRVWKEEIRTKAGRVAFDPATKSVRLEPVPKEIASAPALSHEKLVELSKQVLAIEARMGLPCDVEWALDRAGTLHVLQARAITQPHGRLHWYADTNLCESYPGVVSPMTASFVTRIYTKVIGEALELAGATPERLRELKPMLDTLVREHAGHLYYHLDSYYSVLAFMPGGEKNLKAWHQMIGGASQGSGLALQLSPSTWLERTRINAGLARVIARHTAIFDRFCREATLTLDRLDRQLEGCADSRAVAAFLLETIESVRGWGLTAFNDFLVMVGLKALTAVLRRSGLTEDRLAPLLRTRRGVESMRAMSDLSRLAAHLRANERFVEFFDGYVASRPDDPDLEGVFDALAAAGFEDEVARIDAYLLEFGDRAFEELKLESMTFHQSPRGFIDLLRFYFDPRRVPPPVAPVRGDERDLDLSEVRLLDRPWLKVLLGYTKKTIRARESTRLLRGRYYGFVRRCVLALGAKLKAERPELFGRFARRDFFALDLPLLESYRDRAIGAEALRGEIERRRGWDARRIEYPERFCHCDDDAEPYFLLAAKPASEPRPSELRGVGASPGKARGRALVVRDPREALKVADLASRILVTRSTDPAWIFLMSQCAGLLSEKGSLLSHTAIVGRELKIPAVVGATGATELVNDGELIEIDGGTGAIEKLEAAERNAA